jgi:hypothetical protein
VSSDERQPHERPIPTGEVLASLFGAGLEDFRVGGHTLRDADRFRVGYISVTALWSLEILPSFDERAIVAVVHLSGEEFRGHRTTDGIKAVFATPDGAASLDLERDTVGMALNGIDLFQSSRNAFLDGVGYKLTFSTYDLRGILIFSNPVRPRLVEVERAALLVAAHVASASGKRALASAIGIWQRYCDGRTTRPS